MRKVALILFVGIFILSSNIFAQNNNDSTKRVERRQRVENRWTPEKRAEIMAEQLKLSETEKAQVKALLEKNEKERLTQVIEQRAKRENLKKERDARRAEMQELREQAIKANEAELEKIIGKEKVDQWKKYRDENRTFRRESGRRR
jgi:Fe2+ transport system protein B